MTSRTLLLLGGSRQQVVAIERARELGYRTVLCDYLPDNPGRLVADAFHLVSTTNRERVLEVARAEGAEGVIAYSSDPASSTAAYVAERLGLPTNPLASVEVMSGKHLFRKHLAEAGLPCPRAREFPCDTDLGELWREVGGFRMPVVVKPTDSSGSKGVTVLSSASELAAAVEYARGFSRNGLLICEEYVGAAFPRVVGGDVFVRDGEVEFWGLMSCLRDARSPLVPVGKRIPSGLSEAQLGKVKEALRRLVTSLGVRFGELNVEVILGEGDVPYVLELGSRAGGNMIPVQLSDASGVDLVRANVMCAMGDDPGDLSWEGACEGAFATYVLHSNVSGSFEGVELSGEISPHVYRTVAYARPGDRVEAFDGANKALGILFLRFDEERQMEGVLEDVARHVRVRAS